MPFSEPRLARFGPIRGPRMRTQAPKHTPPSAHLTHPLEVTAVPQGPWASVRGHRSPPCHLEDHAISTGEHCPAALPSTHTHCAQDRLVDQGPGRGIFQGTL